LNPLLLDTHAVVWYLRDPARLSSKALEQIHRSGREGIPLFVSVISLVELVYLVEKERLPQAALEELKHGLQDPLAAIQVLPVDSSLIETLERIPRGSVPDMPDRIIAATAFQRDLLLITRDRRLRDCGVHTLW